MAQGDLRVGSPSTRSRVLSDSEWNRRSTSRISQAPAPLSVRRSDVPPSGRGLAHIVTTPSSSTTSPGAHALELLLDRIVRGNQAPVGRVYRDVTRRDGRLVVEVPVVEAVRLRDSPPARPPRSRIGPHPDREVDRADVSEIVMPVSFVTQHGRTAALNRARGTSSKPARATAPLSELVLPRFISYQHAWGGLPRGAS